MKEGFTVMWETAVWVLTHDRLCLNEVGEWMWKAAWWDHGLWGQSSVEPAVGETAMKPGKAKTWTDRASREKMRVWQPCFVNHQSFEQRPPCILHVDAHELGAWEDMTVWKVEILVAQSCPTLCNPMDCSQLGSSVHRILHARRQECVAIPFSGASSQPRDQT